MVSRYYFVVLFSGTILFSKVDFNNYSLCKKANEEVSDFNNKFEFSALLIKP